MHATENGLHVFCARPGLFRAGVPHPSAASYDAAHFTEAQLEEMLAEPAISIVWGKRVLPDNLSDAMGITLQDRTRVEGSGIVTDAGASATTEALAAHSDLQQDVKRAEIAAGVVEHADPAETLPATKHVRRTR